MRDVVIDFATAARAIIETGRRLDRQGLAPATAGNYSVRLADGSVAVTVSGTHKGRLTADQVMRVSLDGASLDGKNPSAETVLHCLVYVVDPAAGAILHTHSVPGVALSRALAGADAIQLTGYELLKIYPDIDTHEAQVSMPLIDNSQHIPTLAARLRPLLADQKRRLPAFYIRGHGLYAWGPTIEAAEHVAEGSEYLLACEWETFKQQGPAR